MLVIEPGELLRTIGWSVAVGAFLLLAAAAFIQGRLVAGGILVVLAFWSSGHVAEQVAYVLQRGQFAEVPPRRTDETND